MYNKGGGALGATLFTFACRQEMNRIMNNRFSGFKRPFDSKLHLRLLPLAIFLIAVLIAASACSGGKGSARLTSPGLSGNVQAISGGIDPVFGGPAADGSPEEGALADWPYDRSWSALDIGEGLIFKYTGEAKLKGVLSQTGDGITVEISAENPQNISGVQGELLYDASKYTALSAEFAGALASAEIKLAVVSFPGRVAAGAAFAGLAEKPVSDGDTLIEIKLANGASRELYRTASRVPQGEANKPRELAATYNEETGMLQVTWRQRLHGDYDQSGEVSVPDITAIALNYLASSGSILSVVDGDGDGVIGVSDITPIALNYLKQQTGFNVYLGSRADQSSPYLYVRKGTSNPSISYRAPDFPDALTRYTFYIPLTEFGGLNVRIVPVGPDAVEAGGETYAELEYAHIPPTPSVPDNIRITDITSTSVTVEWDEITDPFVSDVLCWKSTVGGTNLADYELDFTYGTDPLPSSHTFSGLTQQTQYYFLVTAKSPQGIDSDTGMPLAAFTVDTPPAPKNIVVLDATRTSVTVGWDEISDERVAKVRCWTNTSGGTDLGAYTLDAEYDAEPFAVEHTFEGLAPATVNFFIITTQSAGEVECPIPSPVSALTAVIPVAEFTAADSMMLNDNRPYAGMFDSSLSYDPDNPDPLDPKNGITEYRWDFGDGSAPENTPDPVAYHTAWPSAGLYTVTLTVVDGDGNLSLPYTKDVEVIQGRTDLLVVYNSNEAVADMSREIADYYADPVTGRGIDPTYVVGFDWDDPAESNMEIVTRNYYDTVIKPDMESYIDAAGIKLSIKYIVLCKGVPLKIRNPNQASVDSEMCLLYQSYDLSAFPLWNPFHREFSGANAFTPFGFSYGGTTLSYLVGRLDAYTLEEVKGMIDRAKQAPGQVNEGYVIIDDEPNVNGNPEYDFMHSPVSDWPLKDTTALVEKLTMLDVSFYADNTKPIFLTRSVVSNDLISDNVVGYVSHGIHSSNDPGPLYILNNLDFTYLPGAFFSTYESFNAWSFNDPSSRSGQGLIADFFRMGGTCAIGNVWEPYGQTVAQENIFFEEYFTGRTFIESSYKSLSCASWQQVVVGDPLMKIVAD